MEVVKNGWVLKVESIRFLGDWIWGVSKEEKPRMTPRSSVWATERMESPLTEMENQGKN